MKPALVVLILGLLAAGCQQGKAPAPGAGASAAPTESMTLRLKREGDALMAKGDYEGAAVKYQLAARQEPEDVSIRFALGSALSYLDRRDQTAAEFRWVVEHGQPGSPEVIAASEWLANIGIVASTRSVPTTARPTTAVAPDEIGRLHGKTEWPGVDYREKLIRGRVSIEGTSLGTRGVERSRPFRLGDRYEFKDLPAGSYRLVAEAWGVKLWEQPVDVLPGQETELNLTSASSPVSPSKFPAGVTPPEE